MWMSTSAPIRSSLLRIPRPVARRLAPASGRDTSIVLGTSTYTTRVGAGPFPTELFDEHGEHLSRVGHEFGSVTGRRRRCGWFDAVALRRSVVHSSVSGLCVTKLDVLDGLETLRICVGYRMGGEALSEPPMFADAYAEVEPVYEELPGGVNRRSASPPSTGCRQRPALPEAHPRTRGCAT
jgi:adenylosuccinate synthase